jgi:hypothetical protein
MPDRDELAYLGGALSVTAPVIDGEEVDVPFEWDDYALDVAS